MLERWLRPLAILLTLTTCAPAKLDAGEARVGVRRDAFPVANATPVVTGMPSSELGSYLVNCDGEFMAGGTSGEVWPEAYNFGASIPVLAPSAKVLLCSGGTLFHDYAAAGPR